MSCFEYIGIAQKTGVNLKDPKELEAIGKIGGSCVVEVERRQAQQPGQVGHSIIDAKAVGRFMPPVFKGAQADTLPELARQLGIAATQVVGPDRGIDQQHGLPGAPRAGRARHWRGTAWARSAHWKPPPSRTHASHGAGVVASAVWSTKMHRTPWAMLHARAASPSLA